jgi:holo-[acyl-carrier protein] synthase
MTSKKPETPPADTRAPPPARGGFGFRAARHAGSISAMNVVAHGIDLVDCQRLAEVVARHGQRFLDRVFTPGELAYCLRRKRQIEHLAGRFAAKEAVLKVLGTGWRGGINWTDVEVLNDPAGRPYVVLTGRCRQIADQLGLASILVSISHVETHAMASAIGSAEGRGGALRIGQ